MKKILALLFLFSALPLFGQGTSFPVFNRQGWTMAGAVVGTCQGPANPGTATLYCTSPVTTYTDWTLVVPCTQVTTIPNPPGPPLGPVSGVGCTNPGLTDSHGNATIFAANGFYWALVSGYQVVPQTFPFSIGGGGGGGGGNPCGTTYDVQLNINNGFGCDTGIFIETPSNHTTYNNIFSANQQLDVSDSAHTGIVDIGHSTGTVVDGHFTQSLSSTFVAPGYGIDWPDAQPTAANQGLKTVGSAPGADGRWATQWTVNGGQVSLENLPYIYTDIPCNSPATCADLAPIPVPYAANNFYAGPRTNTGGVGYLTNTVTASDNTGTATNAVFTFPYPTRAGDPLVLIANTNGGVLGTPTDTCGNTWVATAVNAWYVASAKACTSLNTVTQSLGGTGNYIIGGGEISGGGVLDTQAVGGSCGAATGSTYPITFTSLTTTNIDTLVTLQVQGGSDQTGVGPYAGTNGLLLENQSTLDSGAGLGISYSIALGWQPALTVGSNHTTMNYTYTGHSNLCGAAQSITLAFKPSITNNPANPTARPIFLDDLETNVLPVPSDGDGLVFDAIYNTYKNLVFGSGLTYNASTHTLSVTSAGSVAFSGISSGTNTTAAMLVGTGASLAPTGSGTISANEVNGATVPASKAFVGTNSSSQIIDATGTVCSSSVFGICKVDNTTITATAGVISATVPTADRTRSCEVVWGGTGTAGALQSGDDAAANQSCLNDIGVTETITSVKCRSDIGSNTTTVNPTFGSTGSGTTICSGALTCGSSGAYSSSCTVSNGSLTSGSNINPVMGGTLTGTSIHMVVTYTLP